MTTLSEYQKIIKEIAQAFNYNWSLYIQYIHLVEEVGELGEALTVHNGDRKVGNGEKALADHMDLEEEIGDVLFTILELCNQLNLDSTVILEKTFKRYKEKLNRSKIE